MNDEQLREFALQGMEMAKDDLRRINTTHGVIASVHEGEGLRRMKRLERDIQLAAGPDWLNNGRAKDIVFGVLAFGAIVKRPEAIVFASVINEWEPQPAFRALPKERQESIVKTQAPRDYPQYFVAHDALMSMAQSPETVYIIRQRLDEEHELIGEPIIDRIPQSAFEGRGKLFGVEPNPEVVATYQRMMGERTAN